MEVFLNLLMGICLSAASGFRIFVPYLLISIASLFGWTDFGSGVSWLSAYSALIIFSGATVLEISGYYNPWIDNMLDLITTPLAFISGIILTSSLIGEINPFLRWILAVICGGGAAIYVQMISVKARALTSFFKTGIGNPVVSTVENMSSLIISFFAITIPVFALIITITIIISILILTKVAREKIAK